MGVKRLKFPIKKTSYGCPLLARISRININLLMQEEVLGPTPIAVYRRREGETIKPRYIGFLKTLVKLLVAVAMFDLN